MGHQDIADKVAAYLSGSHSSERSPFRADAHTCTNDELYRFLQIKRASSSKCRLPGKSWARGVELMRLLGVEAAEVPGRLGLSVKRWRELVEAYKLLWWRWRWRSRRDAAPEWQARRLWLRNNDFLVACPLEGPVGHAEDFVCSQNCSISM